MSLSTQIKNHTPEFAKRQYHKRRAFLAALKNGFPAKDMIVIGITGTKGKTSTANYVWSVLRHGGYRTGLISTANFRLDEEEELNAFHMTMPSPFVIQQKLREMQKRGIRAVVVEMTSEGMKQFRHTGIPVDIAIFTNLTPEHLVSHNGSFEEYKKAKAPLFKALNHPHKNIDGRKIPRAIIANADSEHSAFYLQFQADTKITFGMNGGDVQATDIVSDENGTRFSAEGEEFSLTIPGAFNIYNALPALIVGEVLGIKKEDIKKGLAGLTCIPGRMDEIKEGQDFKVFVDYAHEPASLGTVLSAGIHLKSAGGKVILLMGGQGGGRDPRKRAPMAEVAAAKADFVIVTNEDPYDDDPKKIVEEIATLVESAGKTREKNLFAIMDRKQAIRKALSLAGKGDIVLITGKGAETTMMVRGGAIAWNEREIVRESVRTYLSK